MIQVSHVMPLPQLPMHLLDHPILAHCTKEQSSTPVTLDIGSLKDPSQDLLAVGMTGPGGLYQLVNVCEVAILINKYSEWYTVVDCGSPPTTIGNGYPGIPTSTTYQGTVTYTCVSGYEIFNGVTTAMAACMAGGMWGPLPTCSRMYQIPLLLHTLNKLTVRHCTCFWRGVYGIEAQRHWFSIPSVLARVYKWLRASKLHAWHRQNSV